MGKSRTSPLQKTGSSIGVGGSIGGGGLGAGGSLGTVSGSGNSAGFAQAQNIQAPTGLNTVNGATVQTAPTIQQAQNANNANFKDTDTSDYHDLYNGRQYFANQNLTIDQQIATMNYVDPNPMPNSMYSLSQNMNHKLATGQAMTQTESDTYRYLMQSMHNLGYNTKLQRYDHEGFINGLLSRSGVANANYEKMSEKQLQQALVGKSFKDNAILSTSYNNFKNAPSSNPFTSRAVKIEYRAKANTQAMMPGNGSGGRFGEILLANTNNYTISGVKFDGRSARAKGTQSYNKKGVTIYIDVEKGN